MIRWLFVLVILSTPLVAFGDDQTVDFPSQVAPILVQQCVACHGPKKAFAHYRVDTYDRLMAASDAGRNIEPGKPDDSLFLELIVQAEPTGRMPKNSDPLTDSEKTVLRRWIEQGAKPGAIDPSADLATLVSKSKRPSAPERYRTAVPIAALAFRPDGNELAVGGYHEVTIWEPTTGQLLRRLPGMAQRTQGLAYRHDGSLLAVVGGTPGESGELVLVDPLGGSSSRVIASAADIMLGVSFSPDGSLVATSGADRTVRVHDVGSAKELCQVKQFADWVTGVAFDRDGNGLAATSTDKLVKVFEARTGKLATTYVLHNEPVFAVAFDFDSNKAVTAGADRKLHVWDPKVIASEDGTAALLEDRFKKDLSSTQLAGFGDDILKVVTVNGQIFSASADGKVRQHDLKTSRLVRTFEGSGDWVYSVSIDASGRKLAVGGSDGTVRIFDVESGREILRFLAAPGLVVR